MPVLTPDQIEENKRLGLHPQFWETAFELPEVITPEFLDETFPEWRRVGAAVNRALATHMQVEAQGVAS